VVDDGQRRVGAARDEADARGTGVERVGNDLGEDGLLDGAGVGIAEVLEEMLEVDPGFTHTAILARSSLESRMHRESREIRGPGFLLDLPDLLVNSDDGPRRAAGIARRAPSSVKGFPLRGSRPR